MVITLVEEIKKQVQYFNKILTLFIIIFVMMTVIIAAMLVMGTMRDTKIESLQESTSSLGHVTTDLYNVITDTLQTYAPDRAAQQLSRETIQSNNILLQELNGDIKNLTDLLSSTTNQTH